MVEKVVVMNCHVQQKVKVGKTVCDEASVVPCEVHSRDSIRSIRPVIRRIQGRIYDNSHCSAEFRNFTF